MTLATLQLREDPLTTAAPVSPGSILHETYQLIDQLGSGGMGTVWRAQHRRLPKLVAVKLLRCDIASDPQLTARFQQEAAIVAQLRHPHIIEVVDYNVLADGQPYVVFELLEGESLRARLTRPLRLIEVLDIVEQIGIGLQAAHQHGVIHRDLKPENVFLCQLDESRPHVKILDFGLSKMISSQVALTQTGMLFGTPFYMSPEQATARAVDARSDQYSLACVAFELLCGQPPFLAAQPMQVLYLAVHEPPPSVLSLLPALPPPAAAAIERGLAKDPADRFSDVRAFAEALAQACRAAPADLLVGKGAALRAVSSDTVMASERAPAAGSATLTATSDTVMAPESAPAVGGTGLVVADNTLMAPERARPGHRGMTASAGVRAAERAPLIGGGAMPASDTLIAPDSHPAISPSQLGLLPGRQRSGQSALLTPTLPPQTAVPHGPQVSSPAVSPAGRSNRRGRVLVLAALLVVGGVSGATLFWRLQTGAGAGAPLATPDSRFRRPVDLGTTDRGSGADTLRPALEQPHRRGPQRRQQRPPTRPLRERPDQPLAEHERAQLAAAEDQLRRGELVAAFEAGRTLRQSLPLEHKWRAVSLQVRALCAQKMMDKATPLFGALRGPARKQALGFCRRHLGPHYDPD